MKSHKPRKQSSPSNLGRKRTPEAAYHEIMSASNEHQYAHKFSHKELGKSLGYSKPEWKSIGQYGSVGVSSLKKNKGRFYNAKTLPKNAPRKLNWK